MEVNGNYKQPTTKTTTTRVPKLRRLGLMEPFSWSCGASSSAGAFQRSDYDKDEIVVISGVRSYNGRVSFSSSLVLDSARGELVEAPAKSEPARVVAAAERSLEALKNHSEAEKRRRARINAHFDALRGLIPGAKKMDKASLLSEVISHLKELKRKAAEASEDFVIPKDIDEVKVEQEDYQLLEGRPNYSIRVSLSCDYRPGLLSDLKRALAALHLIMTRAEIATLGCRMKNVFVMTMRQEDKLTEDNEVLGWLHARSVCQAIRSVIDNASASDEFLRTTLLNKRRRVSMFGP